MHSIPTPRIALTLLFALLCTGCLTSHNAEQIELGGTPGATVTGYYIKNGHRVELTARLPTTLPARGMSQLAVRKTNPQDDLAVKVRLPDGCASAGFPPGKNDGARVNLIGGINISVIDPQESLAPHANALRVISPYWHDGTWVFDDPQAGLQREPFIAGVPEMIDYLVRDIPDARAGFRLTFSTTPFPGYQQKLTWLRAESGGNRYRLADPPMEGWLCPAMFRYFDKAPKQLFVRADPKAPDHS